MSNALLVKTFTEESSGKKCPEKPRPMGKEYVRWLAKMMVSENIEFLMSHYKTFDEAAEEMINLVLADLLEKTGKPTKRTKEHHNHVLGNFRNNVSSMMREFRDMRIPNEDMPERSWPLTDEEKIECQMDGLVDSHYYALNGAAKHGMNLDSMFNVVHSANMAKRNPETGEFERREDGKVIKPEGWSPPDTIGEVKRQLAEGAWTDGTQ